MKLRSLAVIGWLALSPTLSAAGPAADETQPAAAANSAAAVDAEASACAAPEFHALDFWIGRWRVETPKGTHAGQSRIEPALSGCALLEHWTGLFLTTNKVQQGLGLHRYDQASGRWRQAWVDESGLTVDTRGSVVEGRIVYDESDAATGLRSRMTLGQLPGGRVEQIGERWNESEQRWQTTFHLIYHPEP